MAVANALELSTYVISMATAARAAQAVMSSGEDPMTIAEFRFKANISAEFTLQSELEASLSIWRLSLKEKLTIGYKSEWGIEIECKIIPSVQIV